MTITPEAPNTLYKTTFVGGGEMATLMRSQNWSNTGLGPVETWPPCLHTCVSMMLSTPFAQGIYWGEDYIQLYNDAMIAILGANHPTALGQPLSETWSEIWDDQVKPLLERIKATGEAFFAENQLYPILRFGFLEEAYFTFCYTPIRDETGAIVGLCNTTTETTQQVISQRRLTTHRALATVGSAAKTLQSICRAAADTFNPYDIPFALFYQVNSQGDGAELVAARGLSAGSAAAPPTITLNSKDSAWPLGEVCQSHVPQLLTDVADRCGTLAIDPWPESPHSALILPLQTRNKEQVDCLLIAGISPRLSFNSEYRSFLELVAQQVESAIATVRSSADADEALHWLPKHHSEAQPLHSTVRAQTSQAELRTSKILTNASDVRALYSNIQAHHQNIQALNSNIQALYSNIQALNSNIQSSISNCKPARILLVDDNADLRDHVQQLLSERWHVETAANGAIALAKIQQHSPDLVLSDVMLPEMDGFQLLQALRSHPNTNGIPVILLSARAGEATAIKGLDAGADDYLLKPFSTRELITRVNTQLQMSRLRQEQSANRLKDEFLLTVTHELQSPLATILGWARLLQTKSFDPETTTRALAAIERNATIEAKLVKNLLDVASILSGRLALKVQVVDLAALVQNVTATFREVAQAKQIQLIATITDAVPRNVFADGDRLRQVLTNLLDNAFKFTLTGGRVDVGLSLVRGQGALGEANSQRTQDTEPGTDDPYVEIRVTDTGIGIRPDFLPYVFDRFTQAEVPSRHTPGGVGLGLAIARHLIELHHGTIDVASEGAGRGTTFTVRLPLKHLQPRLSA